MLTGRHYEKVCLLLCEIADSLEVEDAVKNTQQKKRQGKEKGQKYEAVRKERQKATI
jgi:hypothetical protein